MQYDFPEQKIEEGDAAWTETRSKGNFVLQSNTSFLHSQPINGGICRGRVATPQLQQIENMFVSYHGNGKLKSGKTIMPRLSKEIYEIMNLPLNIITHFVPM